MPEKKYSFQLCAGCRQALERVASDEITRSSDARKACALLLAADGVPNLTIAREVGASPTSTLAWRRVAEESGLACLAPADARKALARPRNHGAHRAGRRAEGQGNQHEYRRGVGRAAQGKEDQRQRDRQSRADDVGTYADSGRRRGRPAEIPGLELSRIADALTHNDHAARPLSMRQLAVRLGVSTATLTRVRADLRITPGSAELPRHHLVEVVGILLAPGVSAVAIALDPTTNRAFLRAHRAPHLQHTCPGALVAAMAVIDVLRGRTATDDASGSGRRAEESRGGDHDEASSALQVRDSVGNHAGSARAHWEDFLQRLALEWPTGAHIHVLVAGKVPIPRSAGESRGMRGGQGPATREERGSRQGRNASQPALLRIRHAAWASWQHERMTLMARVVRAGGRRENFTSLPHLLVALEGAMHRRRRSGSLAGALTISWVAPRSLSEANSRRSRADLIERTREF